MQLILTNLGGQRRRMRTRHIREELVTGAEKDMH